MHTNIQNPIHLDISAHYQVHPADPGVGVPLDWPCPVNARVHITHVRFFFDTLNANRFPLLEIVRTIAPIHIYSASTIAPGAGTFTYFSFSTATLTPLNLPAAHLLTQALSNNIIIEPGDTFRITVTTLDGTIEISDIDINYRQWIIA